ncbi:MAG: flagellar filament capping protein FliD [Gammaproteobacteria bacterium]|nr:flagellar filament capping protein FliD [Gammaproteobacteria bacterium]
MATFQAPGIGSGLDVNSIVSQLMALERQPIDKLNKTQSLVNAQISAYGSLKSKVSDFQSAMASLSSLSSFQVFGATSGDDTLFTATADSTATAGSYAIDVVALAERDKIATKAYTDTASVVGEGTLTIATGTASFDVVIDGTNNTVAGIRDAINDASDNTGVTATIVTDDAGAHLVLSSDETGTANALKITVADSTDGINDDDAGLSSLAYDVGGAIVHRAAISTAADSVVKIDGFTVTSSSNTVSGALEGVSITAKALGSSTLSVTRDDSKISASVQKFADAFNALRKEIDKQRSGQLEADSTLLNMERQMFSILNSGTAITGSNQSYLVEAGVTIDKLGVMSVDSSAMTELLNSDFNSFANLFAAPDEGFAFRLDAMAEAWLATDGLIDARESGLKTQVDSIDEQKERIEIRLERVEARIRAQFSALDGLVSSLNATGNFLTQQLASMPAFNKS